MLLGRLSAPENSSSRLQVLAKRQQSLLLLVRHELTVQSLCSGVTLDKDTQTRDPPSTSQPGLEQVTQSLCALSLASLKSSSGILSVSKRAGLEGGDALSDAPDSAMAMEATVVCLLRSQHYEAQLFALNYLLGIEPEDDDVAGSGRCLSIDLPEGIQRRLQTMLVVDSTSLYPECLRKARLLI